MVDNRSAFVKIETTNLIHEIHFSYLKCNNLIAHYRLVISPFFSRWMENILLGPSESELYSFSQTSKLM